MTSPFISVVMPVYNAHSRLTQAAGSVLGQSFFDIELILVDDASSDGSRAECESLAKIDSRVRVLALTENGGLPNARNMGFNICRGTYVHFMDADDTIEGDLYARCREALEKAPADWAAWGVTEEYYDAAGKIRMTRRVETNGAFITEPGALRRIYLEMEQRTLFGYAWNKLYRAATMRENRLSFPNIRLVEDVLFNIEYAKAASGLLLLDGAPYRYARNAGATLTSGYIADYFDLCEKRLDTMLALYRGWREDGREVRALLAGIYVRYLYSALARNCYPQAGMTHRVRKEWLAGRFASGLHAELMPYAAPDNPVVKVLARWVIRKRLHACLAAARIIHLMQITFPGWFLSAKQNR